MKNGLRGLLVAALALLVPLPALAAWTAGGAGATESPETRRTFTALYTSATDDAGLDTSSCDEISLSWLSSITDSDATAKAIFYGCPTSSFTTACKQLGGSGSGGGDNKGSTFGPASFKNTFPYTVAHITTGPSGKTARATAVCIKALGTVLPGCKSYPFTTSGTFGPIPVFGNQFKFTIDGNSATSSTVGASATVNGCIDTGYGSATCSCDMLYGSDSCTVYDGTAGNQGFTSVAPQAVTVTISSAAQAGTFELCSW